MDRIKDIESDGLTHKETLSGFTKKKKKEYTHTYGGCPLIEHRGKVLGM